MVSTLYILIFIIMCNAKKKHDQNSQSKDSKHYVLHGNWVPKKTDTVPCEQKNLETIWYNSFFNLRGCCPVINEEFQPEMTDFMSTYKQMNRDIMLGMINQLRHKHIVIAGDSVVQQVYNSFQLLMEYFHIKHIQKPQFYKYENDHTFTSLNDINRVCDIAHHEFTSYCSDKPYTPPREKCDCSIIFQTYLPSYNLTISYLFFYTFGIPDSYYTQSRQQKMFNHMQYTLYNYYLSLSDAMIFNIGVHYDRDPVFIYGQMIRYIRDTFIQDTLLHSSSSRSSSNSTTKSSKNKNKITSSSISEGNSDSDIDSDSASYGGSNTIHISRKKHHAFLFTEPVHFPTNGKYHEFEFNNYDNKKNNNKYKNINNENYTCSQSSESHITTDFARGVLGNSINTIDFTPLLIHRGDLHSIQEYHDCTHWCYSYEIYYSRWDFILRYLVDGLK